jgi:hypothetical protein
MSAWLYKGTLGVYIGFSYGLVRLQSGFTQKSAANQRGGDILNAAKAACIEKMAQAKAGIWP